MISETKRNVSNRAFRNKDTDSISFGPRVFGTRGVVTADHYFATQAGLDILRAGGNAVDAAAAAAMVEGVVNQQMHSIGGEMPILLAGPNIDGVVCINGNMSAPGRATPDAFRRLGFDEVPHEGIMAAGVPGALAALVKALSLYGRKSFAEIAHRAIELAKNGFPGHAGLVSQHKFGIADNAEKFRREWPGSAALYLRENGDVPLEGDIIRNAALAAVYEHLADAERKASGSREDGLQAVHDAFYRGEVADRILAFSEERGGLLTRSDFENFEAPIEKPCSIIFHGVELHKCGPWNQGPALLQSLSILKNFDLRAMGHNTSDYLHTLIETVKLAFADREQFYGDPKLVDVPLETLLSDLYGCKRASLIERYANNEIRPGDPWSCNRLLDPAQRLGGSNWGPGTVHVDAADSDGFMAAFTPSGGWIRSSEIIPSLGFPLSIRVANCWMSPSNHPNIVAPGKRPRTTISPSLATKNGTPWLAFGSMGGDQQDQWQLQFFLNRVLFGMPLQKAIEAPKFSSEHFPALFASHDFFLGRVRIEENVGEAVLSDLTQRGHDLDIGPAWSEGFIGAVERDGVRGLLEAGKDLRGTKSEVFPSSAGAL